MNVCATSPIKIGRINKDKNTVVINMWWLVSPDFKSPHASSLNSQVCKISTVCMDLSEGLFQKGTFCR